MSLISFARSASRQSLSSTTCVTTADRPRRRQRRPALLATAATVAVAALAGGAGSVAADGNTVPNSPRVQLQNYQIPATAPKWVENGDLLPVVPGTLGNPTSIYMSGSSSVGANSQVIEIPGGSNSWGTLVKTRSTTVQTAQTWYFQRVGYIGLATPAVDGVNAVVGAPVYKIINYNPTMTGTASTGATGSATGTIQATGYTCLGLIGGTGAAFTRVASNGCDANSSNQLWVVGSSAQSNGTFNPVTGQFTQSTAPQTFSPVLQQSKLSTATGLQNSVLMNVVSLQEHNWDTNQTPVLSAASNNMYGENAELWLMPPTQWPANSNNSTWNIVASYAFNQPSTPLDKCAGVRGVAVMFCGGTYNDYLNWLQQH